MCCGSQFICQPIVLRQHRTPCKCLHIRESDRGLIDRSRLIQRCDIRAGFIDESHRVRRSLACIGIARVVDPIRVVLAVGGVFDVADGESVTDGVGKFVQAPQHDFGLSLGFDPGIGGVAVFEDLAALGPGFPPDRTAALAAVADDAAVTLTFGAVFGAVGAIGAADGNKTLAVEAVAVVGVVVDAADDAILDQGLGAAMNDGEAGEAPAHAEQAVAALAVVAKAEFGLDAGGARRNGDGDGVGEGAAGTDLVAAGGGADCGSVCGRRERRRD